jgi:Domain of unknown function (DUF1876)/Domain of unknown function (DUF1918)
MHALPGDRVVLAAPNASGATRDGEVLETRGPDGGPPYLVRWSDGHEGLFYPGPGALLRVGTSLGGGSSSEVPAPAVDSTVDLGEAHVREWHVRISIFERGDDTDANVVLLADAPQHLTAQGHARRSTDDISVPEIGDEVAVARALRRLADRLLDTAEQDISGVTGEEHVTLKS